MKHRIAGAAVLAFLLGSASPALALSRIASFEWAPATGPVAGYAVYASIGGSVEALVAAVAVPSVTIEVESSTYVRVRVAAFDRTGRFGPFSDRSSRVRLCPGDFDGDEAIGFADWVDARSCFSQPAVGFCAGADLDLDGSVSLSDLHAVDVGSDACALAGDPTTCPGDFDGDGSIGAGDLSRALDCSGQPAQGACAAGDFDGNGTVSGGEVNRVAGLVGSDACALAGDPTTCPGDFDGDGSIGAGDLSRALNCSGQPAQGACAAGDFDGNGTVSGGEVSRVAGLVGSDACALAGDPTTCPGDFDGDGSIGAGDLSRALDCSGQPAQGACAAGDFDGNGTVSGGEVSRVAGLVGSDACAL